MRCGTPSTPPSAGTPVLRPTHPAPAPLAGTETTAVRAVHAAELKLYQDHADAEADLRLSLLKSIGLTNQRAITAPILVLHALTTNDIIREMEHATVSTPKVI